MGSVCEREERERIIGKVGVFNCNEILDLCVWGGGGVIFNVL